MAVMQEVEGTEVVEREAVAPEVAAWVAEAKAEVALVEAARVKEDMALEAVAVAASVAR